MMAYTLPRPRPVTRLDKNLMTVLISPVDRFVTQRNRADAEDPDRLPVTVWNSDTVHANRRAQTRLETIIPRIPHREKHKYRRYKADFRTNLPVFPIGTVSGRAAWQENDGKAARKDDDQTNMQFINANENGINLREMEFINKKTFVDVKCIWW